MQTSDQIIEGFMKLHPKIIDLSLNRIERLLEALGNPQKRLPPVIHVAGTNGKGSTIAFMRAILDQAGFRTHVYTSPHLVHFNERIRLGNLDGGRFVDEKRLVNALKYCEKANQGYPITVFEITTAAAFLLFAENPADFLLLETGLGGRLDATNVIEHPLASVITVLGLDHADFLGTTLAQVAKEKAGIFKKGVPAIIAPQDYQEADAILVSEAERKGANPILVGKQDFSIHEERGRLVYQDAQCLLDLPLPKMYGRHQWVNAGTAIAALRATKLAHFEDDVFEKGTQQANWPGRLQLLTSGNLFKDAPDHSEIWLDGGHNADGGRVLASAMADLEERSSAPLILICGMLNTKDTNTFFKPFKGLARQIITIPVPDQPATRSAQDVAMIAREAGISALSAENVPDALKALARQDWHAPPRILICGSLYLIGHALKINGTPPI